MLTHGDLCSGIGGFALAARWVGWRTRWFSEIDKYCNATLADHWPGVRNHGDLMVADWESADRVDVLTAGFPCQPHSLAGLREGENDVRWIWPGIARAVSVLRPRWVLLENVPGLLSLGYDRVVGDLRTIGYRVARPVLCSAEACGAPHERGRLWILAYADNGIGAGVSGDGGEGIGAAGLGGIRSIDNGGGAQLGHAGGSGREERHAPAIPDGSGLGSGGRDALGHSDGGGRPAGSGESGGFGEQGRPIVGHASDVGRSAGDASHAGERDASVGSGELGHADGPDRERGGVGGVVRLEAREHGGEGSQSDLAPDRTTGGAVGNSDGLGRGEQQQLAIGARGETREEPDRERGELGDSDGGRREQRDAIVRESLEHCARRYDFRQPWAGWFPVRGYDGVVRLIAPEPTLFPVVDGISSRLAVGARTRALGAVGNAIIPQIPLSFFREIARAELQRSLRRG